jgi:hypothetical protein
LELKPSNWILWGPDSSLLLFGAIPFLSTHSTQWNFRLPLCEARAIKLTAEPSELKKKTSARPIVKCKPWTLLFTTERTNRLPEFYLLLIVHSIDFCIKKKNAYLLRDCLTVHHTLSKARETKRKK